MHYIITPSDLDCDLDETSRGDAAFAITHYIITPHAYYGTSISNVKKNKTLETTGTYVRQTHVSASLCD